MIYAFTSGFFLGLSLILAIGAQNTFVLRQGLVREHIFSVSLFCAFSDAILIIIGILGISVFLEKSSPFIANILYLTAAIWLTIYGFVRLREAIKTKTLDEIKKSNSKGLISTLSTLSILTFLNPHVYLDTIILIGTVSQQFFGINKTTFALGAITSSFVFFFSLGYGARLLIPLMKKSLSWRILDFIIAFIMFTIAFKLALTINY